MFDLDPGDLPDSVLDCGAGPSSFCAEAARRSVDTVAVDPIYDLERETLEERIREVTPIILEMMKENRDQFVLDGFDSPEEVVEGRHESMNEFLDDFTTGREERRYRAGSVTDLSFVSRDFDVALSSHFLFLYDDVLSTSFHKKAVEEVLETVEEFRIFPLRNLDAEPSSHLQPVVESLTENGHTLEVREVDYEFRKGINQMLVVST